MKEIYRNPVFYYVLGLVVITLWPLLLWAVYLPNAEESYEDQKKQYTKAQKLMDEILSLDPDRLDFSDSKDGTGEFDYAVVVEKTARLFGIPSANYTFSSGTIIKSGGQKSQAARIALKKVDITKFANFLSTIRFRWPNLQCTQLKLTRKKEAPDMWDVNLDLKYYY